MILLVILVDSSKFKSQKLTKIKRTVFSVVTIYSSIISQCLQSDVTIMLQHEMQQKNSVDTSMRRLLLQKDMNNLCIHPLQNMWKFL